MARYYQTSETPIVEDAMSKVPFNELAQILAMKDESLNRANAEVLKIGQDVKVNPYHVDRDAATQIIANYQSEIKNLQDKISSNKVNAHSYMPELEALKNKLFLDSTTGDIAKINAKGVEMKAKRKAITEALAKDSGLSYASEQERMAYLDKKYLEKGGFQSDVSPEVMLTSRPNLQKHLVESAKNYTNFETTTVFGTDINGVKTKTSSTKKGITRENLPGFIQRTIASDPAIKKSFEEEALIKGLTYDQVVEQAMKTLDLEAILQRETQSSSVTDVSETLTKKRLEEQDFLNLAGTSTTIVDTNPLQSNMAISNGKIDNAQTTKNLLRYYSSLNTAPDSYLAEIRRNIGLPDATLEQIEEKLAYPEKIKQFREELTKRKVQASLAKSKITQLENNEKEGYKTPFSSIIGKKAEATEVKGVNEIFSSAKDKAETEKVLEANHSSIEVYPHLTTIPDYNGKPLVFVTNANRSQFNRVPHKITSEKTGGVKPVSYDTKIASVGKGTPFLYTGPDGNQIYLVDLGDKTTAKMEELLPYFDTLKTTTKSKTTLGNPSASLSGYAGETGDFTETELLGQTEVKYQKGSMEVLEKVIDGSLAISYKANVGNQQVTFVTSSNTSGNTNFKLGMESQRKATNLVDILQKVETIESAGAKIVPQSGGLVYALKGVDFPKDKAVSVNGKLYTLAQTGRGTAVLKDRSGKEVTGLPYNLVVDIIYQALGSN